MPTLDWLNREAAFRTAAAVPAHVLRPHPAGSRFVDASGNLLVQGDNLQALKALLPFYRGQVKCRQVPHGQALLPGDGGSRRWD